MSSEFAVDIQKITKKYGKEEVLKDVTLQISKGQFFGLLGPNGAGKSTLINTIAGLVRPTSGSISIMGQDVIKNYREARRALGLVPQELLDEPFFDIENLLKLQSGYFSIKNNDEWINELLEVMELKKQAKKKMSMLSGGMKRRVLIAMALVHKPSVIILDEPTAGVDINLRRNLWKFIKQLHKLGHTIILTTHYLEEAETLCDYIAIIDCGKIITQQSKTELLKNHNNKQLEHIFMELIDRETDEE
jgi:ABC-2 type transport system ATP-binding protein